jgi:uncharacterized protein YraI
MYRYHLHRPALVVIIVATMVLGLAIPAAASLMGGDVAEIAHTGGDGVNVRVGPSPSSGLVATLPEGFAITVLDGPVSGDDGWSWYAVMAATSSGTIDGWVRADYLSAGVGTTWIAEAPDDSDSAASGVPVVVSTGGPSLNLRGGPSAGFGVEASIPNGAYVDVLDTAVHDADGNGWSQVRYGGLVGYVMTSYLDSGFSGPSGVVEDRYAPIGVGQYAAVAGTAGSGANVRGGPDVSSGIVTALYDDSLVSVVGGPVTDIDGDEWYQVEYGGAFGWIIGRYLAPAGRGPVAPSPVANAIVTASYAYLGVPYLWGGTTPAGFDCSGFTWHVLSQVVGDWYPRPMEDQIALGSWIAPENLLPGDVIYFQNTYQWGVSHVGFYIGDGLFISASGEHDAVGISSLYDPYWSTRYLTARRMG